LRRNHTRLLVTLLVFLSHATAFFGVVVWQRANIPQPTERIDLAMLLIPIAAVYVVAAIRSAIQNKTSTVPEPIDNVNYIVVVFLMTVFFCAGLVSLVFLYPDYVGPTVSELRRWIVIFEIAFGIGFGLIVEDLFGKVETIVVRDESVKSNGAPHKVN